MELKNEEYEYAGFWIRVGASIIDMILLIVIIMPIMFIVYGEEQIFYSDKIILGSVDFLLNYIFPFFATIIFWIYKSATPGKMMLHLKVVDEETGNKLTIGQSIGRYFAYIISIIPLLIGFIWVAWDKKKQSWHDKLAKSVVIRKKNRVDKVEFK